MIRSIVGQDRGLRGLMLLFFLLAFLYSIAVPPFESPDEVWHYGMIQQIATTHELPILIGKDDPRFVESLVRQQAAQAPLYYLIAAFITSPIDQSSFPAMYEERFNQLASIGQPDSPRKSIFLHYNEDLWQWNGPLLALHISRFLSIGLALVTLWAAYNSVRLLAGRQAAFLGTALFVLIPQFLFISSSANNDNAVIAVTSLVIFRLLLMLKSPPLLKQERLKSFAILGLLLALGVLSKISGLWLVPLVIVTLSIVAIRLRSWRWFLEGILVVLGIAIALSGWWFWRNWLLYNDPLAISAWLSAVDLRDESADWWTILRERRGLELSFWGVFGWFNLIYPSWIYSVFRVLEGLLGLGILLRGVQLLRDNFRTVPSWKWQGGALLLFWVVLLTISWVGFMRMAMSAQGRYFFPAATTWACLFGLSLSAYRWPSRQYSIALIPIWGLIALNLATPWFVIRPAYQPSETVNMLPAGTETLSVQFGDALELVGFDLMTTEPFIRPGAQVPLELYWRAKGEINHQYALSVKVWDADDNQLFATNGYPDADRRPTKDWPPNSIIVDRYRIDIPTTVAPLQQVKFSVEVYQFSLGSGEPLQILPLSIGGQRVSGLLNFTSRAIRLELPSRAETPPNVVRPHLQDITLHERNLMVEFDWVVGMPLAANYQALFHLVPDDDEGSSGPPLVTADFSPLQDRLPTSMWLPGDRLSDSAIMVLPSDAPAGTYSVLLGLYDLTTGIAVETAYATTAWQVATVEQRQGQWYVQR